MIVSEPPDKRFNDFGQSPKDAEYIMKYLTATNDLIIDPFLGGGSTAVACMNMNRRFIGQSPKDAEYIMKYLTATNDLIIDPFLGGGSTAVACMNMNRRFIGIDIDPTAIERTKANLRVNLEISNKGKV
jgi:DNA modification methylase